jgi:hypothetical protein
MWDPKKILVHTEAGRCFVFSIAVCVRLVFFFCFREALLATLLFLFCDRGVLYLNVCVDQHTNS